MNESEVLVTLPEGFLQVLLPNGWTVVRQDEPLTVTGPESDVTLSFIARPIVGVMEDMLDRAWQEINPAFDLPVLQKVDIPAQGGWDGEVQVVYDAPDSASRIVFAIARLLGDRAYITLVDGTKAGFSRRAAQFSELHHAWKPAGLIEPSLLGVSPKPFGNEERDAMSRFVNWAMRQLGVPGLAVAVVQNGETVYAEGFGVRRLGSGEPITAETRFMIGSSTKPLTTAMMARLVDLGHFTWSTPVVEVLPGFALADENVTRHLEMRHTVSASTGMPRRDLDLVFRFRGILPEDRIAGMRQMSPTTGFSEIFQYSNSLVSAGGYAAAHSYAPDVSLQAAYDRAMRELVFEPLGMPHTSTLCIDSPLDAAPNSRALDGSAAPIDPALEHFADPVAPAGAVWSNVLDMAEYLKFEMRDGLNARGERVLSAKNLQERRRPAIKIDGKTSYGLGWFLKDRQGLAEIGHGGNTRGFTADMFFLPESRVGMVLLTNLQLANQFLASVEQKLVELLFGAAPEAKAMVDAEKKTRDEMVEVMSGRVRIDAESTAWISNFIGNYKSEELGIARISRAEDGFEIELESGSSKLGAEQSGMSRNIVLTTPPWTTRLQPTDDPNTLLVDGGQTTYRFIRFGEEGSAVEKQSEQRPPATNQ
jgi:CubicO group peptidase (beta-lactamase class C family)